MFELVKEYSNNIQNGRTVFNVLQHMKGEVIELTEEICGANGPDGILGEAVDVLLCVLDIICIDNPNITSEELNIIMLKKLNKWKRRYSHSVVGDRSID
jgi:hypothetical protein